MQGNFNVINSIIKNTDIILSYIPYQVERGYNEITLRFTRFLLFTHKDTFKVESKIDIKGMSTYILKSDKGNKIELFISLKEESNKQDIIVNIAVKYEGEKEWIVGKFLHDIAFSILNGILEESKKSVTITGNFSQSLGKIGFITKLLMKSRLVKTEEITVGKGQLIPAIIDLVQEYLKYQIIYVSGVSINASFRLIINNGDVKGVYVNINGEESFDEKALNSLEGHFKVNVYVSLLPEEVLKGITNESSWTLYPIWGWKT